MRWTSYILVDRHRHHHLDREIVVSAWEELSDRLTKLRAAPAAISASRWARKDDLANVKLVYYFAHFKTLVSKCPVIRSVPLDFASRLLLFDCNQY